MMSDWDFRLDCIFGDWFFTVRKFGYGTVLSFEVWEWVIYLLPRKWRRGQTTKESIAALPKLMEELKNTKCVIEVINVADKGGSQ